MDLRAFFVRWFLKVISKVVAGAGLYGRCFWFLSFIWKNSFVATADVDGLVRIGALRNMTPKPASPARGMIEISGPEGTSIAAGTVVVDEVFGNEYEILNSVTINEVNDQTVTINEVNDQTGLGNCCRSSVFYRVRLQI